MDRNELKVVIAGGGTGGHLFPAFAIADALKKKLPRSTVHFVGSRFGMESSHFPTRDEPHTLLGIRGFGRGVSYRVAKRNMAFGFRFLGAYMKARRLMAIFDPDVVVGTGGYASGLPLLAAIHKRIPTLIHEQNSYPGFTTRWLSSRVDTVCISYPESQNYLKKKTLSSRGIPYVKV